MASYMTSIINVNEEIPKSRKLLLSITGAGKSKNPAKAAAKYGKDTLLRYQPHVQHMTVT